MIAPDVEARSLPRSGTSGLESGAGETRLTELSMSDLRELLALRSEAVVDE